jgi:hypothetical protein
MDYHDVKRPALSVFALAIILVCAILGALSGGEGWQTATGCIVLGSGLWAIWQIGRWGWWRYGQREAVGYTR